MGSSHDDISLREITGDNRDAVVALRLGPGQDRFVNTAAEVLEEAASTPEGNPWCRAIYAGEQPVGLVMLSWDVTPDPPRIIGPWFLWKLLIDVDHQGLGYGGACVRQVADLVRSNGAEELLVSHVVGDGSPGPFYRRLGFRPTGEMDDAGEVILALDLRA